MKISIIGLGYVGLPLARLLATKYNVVGFDINQKRVNQINQGIDETRELSSEVLQSVLKSESNSQNGLYCSIDVNEIKKSTYYIVTVPTPVDSSNHPDLTPLIKASEMIGKVIQKGETVIYESTVYPGATEEKCIPIIEQMSGLKFNQDFFAGYSPERINPGDKEKTVDKILKITSGSTPEIAEKIDKLYSSVITGGTYKASSIKVAEAAKVIENSQRDINIAFVNELSKIFSLMKIDTNEVLEAAATKWNFIKFSPGLVGGHCIGVDPYYLAQKSIELGYQPDIILSGRKLNDSMGQYISSRVVKHMVKKDINIKGSKVLILGFTFKENCPDVRNTKVIDIVASLKEYGLAVDVYDPHANNDEVVHEYNISLTPTITQKYSAVVVAVAHTEFSTLDFSQITNNPSVIFDVKGILDKKIVDERL